MLARTRQGRGSGGSRVSHSGDVRAMLGCSLIVPLDAVRERETTVIRLGGQLEQVSSEPSGTGTGHAVEWLEQQFDVNCLRHHVGVTAGEGTATDVATCQGPAMSELQFGSWINPPRSSKEHNDVHLTYSMCGSGPQSSSS